MKIILYSVILMFCASLEAWAMGDKPAGEPLPPQEKHALTINSKNGTSHRFEVEIANTPTTRSIGMMYRQDMPKNTGMLFIFDQEQQATMWMKNTFLPLDMLFIRNDGTIIHIHRNATPHSTERISSPAPVIAVLELFGGVTQTLGINTGDRVSGPAWVIHTPG